MAKSSLTLEQKIINASSLAVEFKGICFRNVQQKYANNHDIRSSAGSYLTGGRFNFSGAFGVLYLSCDFHTCVEEVISRSSPLTVAKTCPRTFVGLKIELSKVLDLTRKEIRRAIGISSKQITDTDWWHQQRLGTEAFTQLIGKYARDAEYEAVLVPSAKFKGANLNVFCDNVLGSSKLSVVNLRKLIVPAVSPRDHRQKVLDLLGIPTASLAVQRNLFCS